MQMHFKKGSLARLRTALCAAPLFEGETPKSGALAELDAACGGQLSAVIRSGDFTGKLYSQVTLYNPNASGPRRVLLVGAGKPDQVDLERVRQVASRAVRRAQDLHVDEMAILFPQHVPSDVRKVAQALAEGCSLGDYRFDKYMRTARDDKAKPLQSVTFVAVHDVDKASAQEGIDRGAILGDVVSKARDMVNAPANELTPTEMAERAATSARTHGFKAEILEKRDMQRLGMAGILAVSQGTDQPPKFIVLEYEGAGPRAPRYVFVGKGLTFDAGGICLKPAPKMDEMKGDMAGGAAAIGAVEAAARCARAPRCAFTVCV